MADDGGWPRAAGFEALASGGAPSKDMLGELRGVLGELERRLTGPGPHAGQRELMETVIQTLETLARRVARNESAAQGRARELAAALSSLSQFMDAEAGAQAAREALIVTRLDDVLSDLAHLKARQVAPRAEPKPIRAILAASGAAAVLSLVAAGVAAVSQPERPQHVANAGFTIWQPLSF